MVGFTLWSLYPPCTHGIGRWVHTGLDLVMKRNILPRREWKPVVQPVPWAPCSPLRSGQEMARAIRAVEPAPGRYWDRTVGTAACVRGFGAAVTERLKFILLSAVEKAFRLLITTLPFVNHVDVGLLGCNVLWTCRLIPTFRRNILSPPAGLKINLLRAF